MQIYNNVEVKTNTSATKINTKQKIITPGAPIQAFFA